MPIWRDKEISLLLCFPLNHWPNLPISWTVYLPLDSFCQGSCLNGVCCCSLQATTWEWSLVSLRSIAREVRVSIPWLQSQPALKRSVSKTPPAKLPNLLLAQGAYNALFTKWVSQFLRHLLLEIGVPILVVSRLFALGCILVTRRSFSAHQTFAAYWIRFPYKIIVSAS